MSSKEISEDRQGPNFVTNKVIRLNQQPIGPKAQAGCAADATQISRILIQDHGKADTPPLVVGGATVKPSLNLGTVKENQTTGILTGESTQGEETPEWKKEMEKLGKELETMQGERCQERDDLEDLCPLPQVEVPNGFRIPDFIKYDGTTDPEVHLRAYCMTMGSWKRDKDFFLAFFHHSLTGFAYNWYMRLDKESLKSWGTMTREFLEQFKNNALFEFSRESIQVLKRRADESFREYARRWRQAAAEVRPPMTNREICRYFVKTLGDPFTSMTAVFPHEDFPQLVSIGEDIDLEAKREDMRPFQRIQPNTGKEKGVYDLEGTQQQGMPCAQTPPNNRKRKWRARNPKDNKPFPDFGMSQSELFRKLSDQGIMGPRAMRPLTPPYPGWYKPELSCEFHMDAPGHSIETCDRFRHEVRALIKSKVIPAGDISDVSANFPLNPRYALQYEEGEADRL